MPHTRQSRTTRSQAIGSNNVSTELKGLGNSLTSIGAPTQKKTHTRNKSKTTTRSSANDPIATTTTTQAGDENLDVDASDNGEDDLTSDQLIQPNVLAPSRKLSEVQAKLPQNKSPINASWTGSNAAKNADIDDQAYISDLDMHGSVSSDDEMEEVHDDDVSSIAESDSAAIEEEIDIADDDDDYADVDNVSDTSEHSDQFEQEVEAAWQHDDIDWNDEYVYQYDESPHRGFLVDDAFLNADLDHLWSNWQIQFLDFDRRESTRSGVIVDTPMHDSPLVRRVNEMNRAARVHDISTTESSDTSTQSREHSAEPAAKAPRIDDDDDDGDETEDDLPEESQYPSPISQQATHVRRNSPASKSDAAPSTVKKKPALCRMPVDTTRVTAFSLPTADGKFVRRVTLPLSGNTEWVTIPGKRYSRNQDGSPTSSISTEMSYQDDLLFHAINGRLFQQAHFNASFGPPLTVPHPRISTHNSFLSGPALHESSLFDDDEFMGFDDDLSEHADITQLVDFDALTSLRESCPPSGRIRAQSAELPATLKLEPSLLPPAPSTTTDVNSSKVSDSFSVPPQSAILSPHGQTRSATNDDVKSPVSASQFPQKKRRASDVSDSSAADLRQKRKRA